MSTFQDTTKYSGTGFAGVYPRELVILPSAARTTVQTQTDQTNDCARGVMVILDITVASGTGGLTLEIDLKDPASGKYVSLLA